MQQAFTISGYMIQSMHNSLLIYRFVLCIIYVSDTSEYDPNHDSAGKKHIDAMIKSFMEELAFLRFVGTVPKEAL